MRRKITIRSVDALAAPDGGEVTLRDTELSGFEVRARGGGAKVYGIRYRVGSGRDAPMARSRSECSVSEKLLNAPKTPALMLAVRVCGVSMVLGSRFAFAFQKCPFDCPSIRLISYTRLGK